MLNEKLEQQVRKFGCLQYTWYYVTVVPLDRHDITEILLKVALNTITHPLIRSDVLKQLTTNKLSKSREVIPLIRTLISLQMAWSYKKGNEKLEQQVRNVYVNEKLEQQVRNVYVERKVRTTGKKCIC
jgi:hypothetical protein